MNYVAFKTYASDPQKPIGMPDAWPRGAVVDLGISQTPPDQSGEWQVMTIQEFEGYKAIHRPSFDVYAAQAKLIADTQKHVAASIESAKLFGSNLKFSFIIENVLLGITQLGLTNHVRKTLMQVDHAIQNGSLYDAIEEIAAIPPESLDAAILSESRILAFRNKLESHVGVPLATTWNQPKTW